MKVLVFSLLFSLVVCSPIEILNVEDAEAGYGHVMSGVPGEQVEGSFFWRAPEGDDISLVYTAGEAGYLAEGDHLPVSPEVPAAPEMVLPMMVDFTPEVAAARSSFLEKFNEAKMKAEEETEESMIESDRRRRDAAEDEEPAVDVEDMKTQPQMVYSPYLHHLTIPHLAPVHVPHVTRTVQAQPLSSVFPVSYPMFRYPGLVWSYPGSPLTPTVSVVPARTLEREGVLPNQKLEGEDEPAALEF